MLATEQKLLQIGLIGKQSGVPIKTIRYYEDLGLIHAASRTDGGFRLFSVDVLERLNFIRRSQSLGFSLQEIKQILQIHDQGDLPCHEVRHKIAEKVTECDHKILQLQQLKSELNALAAVPESNEELEDGVICPIIQQH